MPLSDFICDICNNHAPKVQCSEEHPICLQCLFIARYSVADDALECPVGGCKGLLVGELCELVANQRHETWLWEGVAHDYQRRATNNAVQVKVLRERVIELEHRIARLQEELSRKVNEDFWIASVIDMAHEVKVVGSKEETE